LYSVSFILTAVKSSSLHIHTRFCCMSYWSSRIIHFMFPSWDTRTSWGS